MTKVMNGRADFLELGSWNVICYRCGRKRKSSDVRKQWQGFYVCKEEWEPHHPQFFVKGIVDVVAPPWTQPDSAPIFVPMVNSNSTSAIPSLIIPGQSIPRSKG